MRITVFGSTGGSGLEVVAQALQQSHNVTAFARTPSKLTIRNAQLRVVQGNAMNPSDVEAAVKGQDAVVSALGVSGHSPITICSEGMKNIISAMKNNGVKRLIVESAYGAGDTRKGFYGNATGILIASRIKDKELMEKTVAESGLDWIIARPVYLTNGPRTGSYRVGLDLSVSLWPKISRADVADFMLKQLSDNTYLHKMPTISH